MTGIDLFIAPEVFTPRVERRQALQGATLAAMLTRAVREGLIPQEDIRRAVFHVNGLEMPRATAEERLATLDFVPAGGDVVNITVEPLGGGGGNGNKALQMILQIAVLALSFAVPGMQFLAGASTFVRTAVQAAVAIGGQALITAAFARDTPAQKDAADRRALQDQSNQIRQREAMPIMAGEQRFAFDVAAKPYTQLVGEDVWLHVIFGVHYGKCRVADIKIGETKLTDYPAADVRIHEHLAPGPRNLTLYPSRVVQENLSDQIEIGGDWEVHTTAIDTERVELDFTWPGGLRFNKDNGKTLKQQVQLEVQVAPVGTEAWTPAPFPGVNEQDAEPLGNGFYRVHDRSNEAIRRTLKWALPVKGQVKIRVRATEPDGDERSRSVDATYWTAIRSLEAQKPIVDETLSIIEMQIRSSDDLNGSLPVVSGVVTPIVPVWNGVDWDEEAPTSNQAAIARWLLTGAPAARPLPPERIDFSEAFEVIAANGWEAGVPIVNDMSQEEALLALGRAGRFSAFYDGAVFRATPDWEKPVARQLFTQRNAQGLRYRRSFHKPLHGVLVEYRNRGEEDRQDELYVYADGYTADTAQLIETLSLPISITSQRAYKEGRVYLAKRELLVESFEWSAGADTIATTYGDRVLVSHPSTLFGEASARVQNRIWQGALVAGVRLDTPVRMEAGKTYAIDVRTPDAILKGLEVVTVAGEQRSLMFPAPLTEANAPGRGDLLAFGRTELITEDLDIVDFDPADDGTVTIRAQRYMGAEILAAETGEIPDLQTKLQALAKAPVPRFIGPATGSPDGVIAAFDVEPLFGYVLAGFQGRWRLSPDNPASEAGWQPLPPMGPNARLVRTPAINGAQTEEGDAEGEFRVDLELRSQLRNGDLSAPARLLGALVTRVAPPVENFDAVPVIRMAPDGSTYGAIAAIASPLIAGNVQNLLVQIRERPEIGEAGMWKAASGGSLPATNPVGDLIDVKGGQRYGVRAAWQTSDNWPGSWTPELIVLIPAGADTAYDTGHVGGRPTEEVIDRLDALAVAEELAAAALLEAAAGRQMADDLLVKYGFLNGEWVGTLFVRETTALHTADQAIITEVEGQGVRLATAEGELLGVHLSLLELEVSLAGKVALTEFNVLKGRMDTAEGSISAQALQITNILLDVAGKASISDINALDARLDSAESSLSGAITDINQIELDLAGKASIATVSGINGRLTTAEGTLSGAVNNISSLQLDVAARALASDLNTLSLTVGGHTTSISQQSLAILDINGRLLNSWSVQLNGGGRVQGLKYQQEGGGSVVITTFDVEADRFRVWNGAASVPAFEVVGGQAYVSGNRVRTESVVANAITSTVATQATNNIVQVHSVSFGNKILEQVRNTTGGDIDLSFSASWIIRNVQELYFYVFVDSDYSWTGSAVVNQTYELPVETSSTGDIQNVTSFNCLVSGLAAGSHTFRIYIRNTTGSPVDIRTRTLITREFKR